MNKRVSFARPTKARRNAEDWVSGAEDESGGSASAAEQADVPMKRLTIDIQEELHRRVKVGCALRGEKIADVVRRFLEEEFPPSR